MKKILLSVLTLAVLASLTMNAQYFENQTGGKYYAGSNGFLKMKGTKANPATAVTEANGAFVGEAAAVAVMGGSDGNRLPGTVVWSKIDGTNPQYVSYVGTGTYAAPGTLAPASLFYTNLAVENTGVKLFSGSITTDLTGYFFYNDATKTATTATIEHECATTFVYAGTDWKQPILSTYGQTDNAYANLTITNTYGAVVNPATAAPQNKGTAIGTNAGALFVYANAVLESKTSTNTLPFNVGSYASATTTGGTPSACVYDHSTINGTLDLGTNNSNFNFGGNGGQTLADNDVLILDDEATIIQTGAGEGYTLADSTAIQLEGEYDGENTPNGTAANGNNYFITSCDNPYYNIFVVNGSTMNTGAQPVYVVNAAGSNGSVTYTGAGLVLVGANAGTVLVDAGSVTGGDTNRVTLPWDGNAGAYNPSDVVPECNADIAGWISRQGEAIVPNKPFYFNSKDVRIALQVGKYTGTGANGWQDNISASSVTTDLWATIDECNVYSEEGGTTTTTPGGTTQQDPTTGGPQMAYKFSFYDAPNTSAAPNANADGDAAYRVNNLGAYNLTAGNGSGYVDRLQAINFGAGVRAIRSIELGFENAAYMTNASAENPNTNTWASNELRGFAVEHLGNTAGTSTKRNNAGYNTLTGGTQGTGSDNVNWYREYAGAPQAWYGTTVGSPNVTTASICSTYVLRNEYVTLNVNKDLDVNSSNTFHPMDQIIFTEDPTILASTKNGRWSDPKTWDAGSAPQSKDLVEINTIVYTGLYQNATVVNDVIFGQGSSQVRNYPVNEYDLTSVDKWTEIDASTGVARQYAKIAEIIRINSRADAATRLNALTSPSTAYTAATTYPALIFGNHETAVTPSATGDADGRGVAGTQTAMKYDIILAASLIINNAEVDATQNGYNRTVASQGNSLGNLTNVANRPIGLIVMDGRSDANNGTTGDATFLTDGFTQPIGPAVNAGNYVQSGGAFIGAIFEVGAGEATTGTAPFNGTNTLTTTLPNFPLPTP